jgi:hypothetical protein
MECCMLCVEDLFNQDHVAPNIAWYVVFMKAYIRSLGVLMSTVEFSCRFSNIMFLRGYPIT